jgi:hypothetical protein
MLVATTASVSAADDFHAVCMHLLNDASPDYNPAVCVWQSSGALYSPALLAYADVRCSRSILGSSCGGGGLLHVLRATLLNPPVTRLASRLLATHKASHVCFTRRLHMSASCLHACLLASVIT